MVLKARFIKRYKGFDIMKDISKGYFIMLSIKNDSIRIIEDDYFNDTKETQKEINKILSKLGENAIQILKENARARA